MHIRIILTSLAFLVMLTSPVLSQFYAIESFDYPKGAVLDDIGIAENGWAGSWFLFDSSWAINDSVFVVSDTGIVYDDLSYSYPHSGRQITGQNSVEWGFQRYGRYLDQTWPDEEGNVYWMSVFMQIDNLTTDQSWTGIGLYDSTSEGPLLGKGWNSLEYTFGHGGDNPDEQKSGILVASGPQWLAAKMVMSGDTMAERIYMWVSPDPSQADLDTNIAEVRSQVQINNGFNRVVAHFGGGAIYQVSIDEIRLGTSWTDVSITNISQPDIKIPVQFALSQNYPNPFNPSTTISYSVQNKGEVSLIIYDLLGREVAVLVNRVQNAGNHVVSFSGNDLPSGIYYYTLKTDQGIITKKMVLLK